MEREEAAELLEDEIAECLAKGVKGCKDITSLQFLVDPLVRDNALRLVGMDFATFVLTRSKKVAVDGTKVVLRPAATGGSSSSSGSAAAPPASGRALEEVRGTVRKLAALKTIARRAEANVAAGEGQLAAKRIRLLHFYTGRLLDATFEVHDTITDELIKKDRVVAEDQPRKSEIDRAQREGERDEATESEVDETASKAEKPEGDKPKGEAVEILEEEGLPSEEEDEGPEEEEVDLADEMEREAPADQ